MDFSIYVDTLRFEEGEKLFLLSNKMHWQGYENSMQPPEIDSRKRENHFMMQEVGKLRESMVVEMVLRMI